MPMNSIVDCAELIKPRLDYVPVTLGAIETP